MRKISHGRETNLPGLIAADRCDQSLGLPRERLAALDGQIRAKQGFRLRAYAGLQIGAERKRSDDGGDPQDNA
jgi:hypothetical protein